MAANERRESLSLREKRRARGESETVAEEKDT